MVSAKKIILALSLMLVVIVYGCSSKPETDDMARETGNGGARIIRAAMVTDVGGIGDESFNAMAWQGLQKAGKELGIEIKFLESREQADYVINLSKLAEQKYDLIFAVGYLMEDAVKQVADKYPNVKFAIIDGSVPNKLNVASLKFHEEQGAFLVGALAGMMTKTTKIGFIGGTQIPLIEKFEYGYKAGAVTVRPNVHVLTAYCGRFDDPGKGKELALAQFSQGADIIFHAAGGSGRGVIDAAKTKGEGFYAIGVDSDQDHLAPGRVLTSMMKRVDNAVFATCKSVVDGSFKPGDHYFGLRDNGMGLSPMKYTKDIVPAEVLDKINKLKQMIIDGKIVVPKTADEMRKFKPPII